jgi:lysophospholipase L1-like esterase
MVVALDECARLCGRLSIARGHVSVDEACGYGKSVEHTSETERSVCKSCEQKREITMRPVSCLRLLAPAAFVVALSCSSSDVDPSREDVLPNLGAGGGAALGNPGVPSAGGTPAEGSGEANNPAASSAGGSTSEVVPGDVATGTGGGAAAPAAQGGAGGAPAAEGAGGSGGVLSPIPEGSVLRIMAVGDSITRATCWRARLWDALNQSYAGRFDLVGTLQSNPGCSPANFDADNQGYSSSLITEIAAGTTNARTCDPICPTMADLAQAFMTARPDVLLMHFGTNDVWNARPVADIQSGYSQVVDAARAANPNVVVMVAQIIPMNVSETTCAGCTCPGCGTAVPQLDQQIVSWAASKTLPASPVLVVDQFTGYDAVADNVDGVHPNAQGSQKMADRWLSSLRPLFGD